MPTNDEPDDRNAADEGVASAEVELTFEADAGFALPDLTGLPGVAGVAPAQVRELDATYYDTSDYLLARHRHTLRRRTGGHDAGWHLKRPRPDGFRDELREPLGEPGVVPTALRRLVEAHVRGGELVPVVRLRTRRTATELRAADGRVLLELAQDAVTAELPALAGAPAATVRWDELEAELATGDLELLDAVGARLLAAGARRSPHPSKLARALGDRLRAAQAVDQAVDAGGQDAPGAVPGSAGEALLAYLRGQVDALLAQDPRVRADAHDAVHQMRVACRRLRAVLAAYRPVVDAAAVEPVRAELKWLGEVLGGARDSEVVRDRLLAAVAAEPPELVVGPVERFVGQTYDARYRAAHDAVLGALGGERYFALLDALGALTAAAPQGPAARAKAAKVFSRQLDRTYRRTRRLVDAAWAADDPARREELLHEVRKSAKRARYAGEAATGVLGARADRYAKAVKVVQEVLGEVQDGVVTRAQLRDLSAAAHAAGHDTFTYGRLHGLDQARAERALERFDLAWHEARRARPR